MTLGEIAKLVKGEVVGDEKIVIRGVAGLKEAREGELSFLANKKYLPLLKTTQASAVIVSREITQAKTPLIRTDNPYLALAELLEFFYPNKKVIAGVHPTVVMGKNVVLGEGISIQAYSVLEDGVEIGDRVIIGPLVFLGKGVKIAEDSRIEPQVTIGEEVSLGRRVIIHSGTVIGSDGFGYVQVDGHHRKIPQVGRVEIEDDVEIGANVTIARATLGVTKIGRGTKIDNLVQIAHNVVIGEDSLIAAQAGIAGSTEIGERVTIGGQVGIVGHIKIGDGVMIGAQSGVTKSLPPKTVVFGYPARPHLKSKRIEACISHLPSLYKRIKELERALGEEKN